MRTSGSRAAIFHVLVRGSAWLLPDRGAPVLLAPGDLVLLPHGDGHVLADHPDTTPTAIRALPVEASAHGLPTVVQDRGGERTDILCGTLRFGDSGQRFVLPHLPPTIHAATGPAAWLDATARLLATEVASDAPGADLLVQRLTEILVVQALRAWIQSSPGLTGWPGALSDPRLARSLSAIHTRPADTWTVDELARRAAMSRSAFYDRFRQVVGEPPAAYLTRWRMILAQRALRQPDARVADVAAEVGYGTEAAFCRAFKREVGTTPARWRDAA